MGYHYPSSIIMPFQSTNKLVKKVLNRKLTGLLNQKFGNRKIQDQLSSFNDVIHLRTPQSPVGFLFLHLRPHDYKQLQTPPAHSTGGKTGAVRLLLLGKSFSGTDILYTSFLLVKLGSVPTQEALAKRNETVQDWERSLPGQIQSSASQQGAMALDWQTKSATYSFICLRWQYMRCLSCIATFTSVFAHELLPAQSWSIRILKIYR